MITVMLSGTLAKQPEQRTSKNGNSYCLASIRIQTTEGDLYASVTAFEPLAAILAGMQKGDPCTVAGTGKVTTYETRDGDHRAGLSVTVSRILALVDQQAPPKPNPKADGQGRRAAAAGAWQDQREFAPDPVPF